MGPGSIGFFFTNPVRNRNNDVDFKFRYDSSFYYLTGFEEPDAALVLIPDGIIIDGTRVREILFTNESDAMSETWLGYRMGPGNAKRLLLMEAAFPNKQFEPMLTQMALGASLQKSSLCSMPFGAGDMLGRMVKAYETWRTASGFSNGANLASLLRTMRGVKSPAEIALVKKAAEISVKGHIEAMRSAQPGMREYEIGALVNYMFGRDGCEYEGYPAICGSGPNSTILHYNTNRKRMESGEVMCMDTAGEYHGYTADVTRSFPINGKFTKEQLEIYNVVLKGQQIGIDLCTSGRSWNEISQKISDSMANDMIKLGLISKASELGRYYMHGFGHGLGLDVHDPAPRLLEPGVILTVEPGIYIKEGSPCDPKYWNIGIRIEDDILVTSGAPVNLSAGAPRDPKQIEALMAQKGIGNVAFQPIGAPVKPAPKATAAKGKSGKGN